MIEASSDRVSSAVQEGIGLFGERAPGGFRPPLRAQNQVDDSEADGFQDRIETPDGLVEHADMTLEQRCQVMFHRVSAYEDDIFHVVFLPDAVKAADALFHAIRAGRQVVVDQAMAELEIAPLAPGFRGQEYGIAVGCSEHGHLNVPVGGG